MRRHPSESPRSGSGKVPWSGTVVSVQPRIRLTRSFDEVTHTYQGYALGVDGVIDESPRSFSVGVGKAAQAKHGITAGDVVSGEGVWVADPRTEVVELYKVSKLKVLGRGDDGDQVGPPPWFGVTPELPVYRARGHRRLAARTFDTSCSCCIWGCRMAVEIIVDHWNPGPRRYRTETFCYGPLSCRLYKAGPTRKVPGRNGMTYEEADWVDEQGTSHRGEDD